MPWMRSLAVPVLAGLGLTHPAQAAENVDDATVAEARSLAQGFMTELKQALTEAIEEGGPANAIGVCSRAAPGIATELSVDSGWAVGRTALRVRNPRNAPSPEERAVLLRFQERAQAGEDMASLEHVAIEGEGESRYIHYMKAIPTADLCTTCHGSDIEPGLLETIRAAYPQDAATGFDAGDLRGAFTFVKPLASD
ncbi:MAG TPA: DUF3365 domain-containing protein [Geminicoccaceae bacterium]